MEAQDSKCSLLLNKNSILKPYPIHNTIIHFNIITPFPQTEFPAPLHIYASLKSTQYDGKWKAEVHTSSAEHKRKNDHEVFGYLVEKALVTQEDGTSCSKSNHSLTLPSSFIPPEGATGPEVLLTWNKQEGRENISGLGVSIQS